MKRIVVLLSLLLLIVACGGGDETATTESTPAATAAESGETFTSTVTQAVPQNQPSLISFSAGALVVQKPQEYGGGWPAWAIIDEYPDHGWATPQDVVTPQTFVIELPEQTLLETLVFDTAAADDEKRAAKDVLVEMSDTSATTGFTKILETSLANRVDNQSFPTTAQVPGRWMRLTVKNNHGATDYLELMDVRGYGKQLTKTPFVDASGTYETDYGLFHLKQEGTSVTGCYEYDGGLLTGGIEGRVMKFTWREKSSEDDYGPALMVFARDGSEMFGIWGTKGSEKMTGTWDGKKVSKEIGSCPHWSPEGGAEARMKKELEEFGRTRIYGINFDVDSDVIRDESKPTLDKIVAVMKAQPEWKLTVEGHTDNTGGEAHNQTLSQRRAESVKQYLVNAGVAGERLQAQGFGASKPVGPNETAIGRAQNRRVELAKM